MPPSRRPCLRASLAFAFACAAFAPRAPAETLTITSTPPGASIEINGMAAGTTPYKIDYPAGYFHKPHVAFASRLEHSMSIKISLDGYVTERVTLTEGPFEWNSINGRHHGSYFLLKSAHFNIHLDPESRAESAAGAHEHEGPLIPAAAKAIRPPLMMRRPWKEASRSPPTRPGRTSTSTETSPGRLLRRSASSKADIASS